MFIQAPSPKGSFSAIKKVFRIENLNDFQELDSWSQLLEI